VGAISNLDYHIEAPGLPRPEGAQPTERRWDLAFIGIFAYMVIEYTRLPAMFPILQGLDISKIAAGVGVLGLIISPPPKKKGTSTGAIDICMCLFLGASFVSCFFAAYPSSAWSAIIDCAKWVVTYFLISRAVVSSWRSRIFAIGLLLLNFKLAQFSIRLYLQNGTMNVGGQSVAMVGLGSNAFFGNSNDFGVGMCVVLPIAASLLLGESKVLSRLFYLASFLAIFAAMLLSGCRGALLATCAAIMIAFFRSKRKMVAIIMGVLVIMGTLFLLPKGNLDRLQSSFHPDTDETATQRLGFWRAGFAMFLDHPLTGVGIGNFAPTFRDQYALAEKDPGAWAPHSIYIQGFAELGILGAVPLFVMFWSAVRVNSCTRKHLRDAGADPKCFELRLALGLEMATVAFLISGAFLTTLYYPHFWFVVGMSVGLNTAVVGKYATREVTATPVAELNPTFAGAFHEV
jgi:probable O-glycosylation ligase (exosortase A-associated)